MSEHNPIEPQEERPVLFLIQEIKDGTLNPKSLSKETRLQCVEFLCAEGMTVVQIAQLLERSEKTIQRDLNQIREKNALGPSLPFAKETIGELVTRARVHSMHLMRLARSKGGNIAEKGQSEYAAWRVWRELIEKLQSLGYLPLRPQEIAGDLFHHLDDTNSEKSFENARKSLEEVIDVAQQCGNLTPELQKNVDRIQKRIEKLEITNETEKIVKQSQEIKENNNDQ